MKNSIALVQGSYFLVTGLWPLFSINSFQKVTGPKVDLWLVKTVGVMVSVIGTALLVAGLNGDFTPAIVTLAVGSAGGFAAIEVNYVVKRVISRIYLGDTFLELCLIVWWTSLMM